MNLQLDDYRGNELILRLILCTINTSKLKISTSLFVVVSYSIHFVIACSWTLALKS